MAITEFEAQALVRAHQAGDERAFEQIVRTQYQALYAHAYKRLSNHESAEDAVQDTLLRAYRALPNLDGDLRLQAWLHRILTNVCHDEGNRRMRQAGLIDKLEAQPVELAPDPSEEAGVFDTVKLMAEALDQLPESYRQALVLRYVDGLSFREVAEATGVSEENARARVHRGRLALRSLLSHIALIAAFLIPGLRKAQHAKASAEAAAAAGNVEPAISLTTQLTSHVVQAAPAMSRVAEMASAFPGGKSALLTTAVAAVAAVSVPVAATVTDNRPVRPPAVSASAAPAKGSSADGAGDALAGAELPGTTTTAAPTTTTLPPSQAHPFEDTGLLGMGETKPSSSTSSSTSSTSTSTTSTTSTTIHTGPLIEGTTKSDDLTATKTGQQYDLAGTIVLGTPNGAKNGRLEGRLTLFEDGKATADGFTVTTADDKTLELRFKGSWTPVAGPEGSASYRITGTYSFAGAGAYGLAELGDVIATFRYTEKGVASLTTDLKGRARS